MRKILGAWLMLPTNLEITESRIHGMTELAYKMMLRYAIEKMSEKERKEWMNADGYTNKKRITT